MTKKNNVSLPVIVRCCATATAALAAVGALAATPALAKTLYVSPGGHNHGRCTKHKPCKTISHAIGRTHRGDRVLVASGTYHESVTVSRDIQLIGVDGPVVNARGFANGILIKGTGAAGAMVDGFVVQNATDEGILALGTSAVTISDNVVSKNDTGVSAKSPTGECAGQGTVPGDCGEGLHLMSVSRAKVIGNTVENNLGGILLTDELGPTNDNLIASNTVLNNVADCGITLAGHNTNAASGGTPEPTKGGVFNNVIIDNTADGNGTKGQGGGILIAAGAPGSAVYGNRVQDNVANGNGLGGFTLHSHAPGQYFADNEVIDNTFLHDGLEGYPNGQPGDSDAGITNTVGIIVFSALTPLTGTVIEGNTLGDEYYGIWTQNVPALAPGANSFGPGVTVDVFQK